MHKYLVVKLTYFNFLRYFKYCRVTNRNENKLELILVIPVFNEEQIIKTVIKKWLKTIKKINSKIIIINDGSTDKTKKIIQSILTKRIILINKKILVTDQALHMVTMLL